MIAITSQKKEKAHTINKFKFTWEAFHHSLHCYLYLYVWYMNWIISLQLLELDHYKYLEKWRPPPRVTFVNLPGEIHSLIIPYILKMVLISLPFPRTMMGSEFKPCKGRTNNDFGVRAFNTETEFETCFVPTPLRKWRQYPLV